MTERKAKGRGEKEREGGREVICCEDMPKLLNNIVIKTKVSLHMLQNRKLTDDGQKFGSSVIHGPLETLSTRTNMWVNCSLPLLYYRLCVFYLQYFKNV